MRQRLNMIAVAAVVSALTVAGLAVAQGDDGNDRSGGDAKVRDRFLGPPPGGPVLAMHADRGDLTYSETHLREDGEDVTVRMDKGKLTASDDESVTIERNDGETVEIPVDDDTRVMAGPRNPGADLADVDAGTTVLAIRRSGSEAAQTVGVVPKHPLRMRLRRGPDHDPDFGAGAMPLPAPPYGGGQR